MTHCDSPTATFAAASLPIHEAQLPVQTAEPWLQVSKDFRQLEGLCFDRAGNLFFLDVFGGRICRVQHNSTVVEQIYQAPEGSNPASIKLHRDGRLFLCCLGDFHNGCIMTVNPDGSDARVLLSGYVADDLVFDAHGGFYFTHFVGSVFEPLGGVFYVAPGDDRAQPLLRNMAGPNGLALTTNGKGLWVTETNANRLSLIELGEQPTSIAPYGSCVAYQFTGYHGPDSCSIDADDNLYVAMYGQGRVMVFNKLGLPIGQIAMPGRERGSLLRTTHPMIAPGTRDLYICTNDHDGPQGAWIMRAQAQAIAAAHFHLQA